MMNHCNVRIQYSGYCTWCVTESKTLCVFELARSLSFMLFISLLLDSISEKTYSETIAIQ